MTLTIRIKHQGDILAGCVAVAVCWAMKNPHGVTDTDILHLGRPSNPDHSNAENVNIWSALFACELTRRSSCLAYEQCRRSMSSPDVLLKISDAFESMMPHTPTEPADPRPDSTKS